jgi:hypothetical protein
MPGSVVDVYTDFQGWQPAASDLPRFVTRARARAEHFEPCLRLNDGRHFTDFRFSRDQQPVDRRSTIRQPGTSSKASRPRYL